MTRLSRRALLAGLGATTLTLAGCTSSDDSSDSEENGTEDGNGNPEDDETPDGEDTSDEENPEEESTETDLDVPSSLDAALGFVHLPESWDGALLRLSRPDRSQEQSVTGSKRFLTDDSTLDWVVTVGRPEAFVNGVVATGSVTVPDSDQVSASGTQNGFDVYETEEGFGSNSEMTRLATDGEFLVAGTQEWVETALSNHAEGVSPLASRDGVGAIVEALGVDNDRLVIAIGSSLVEEEVGGEDFSFSTVPAMFGVSNTRTEETVEYTVATWYTEPTGETERAEFTELVQSEFGLDDEPEQRRDGRLLRIQHSRPYVPPEERPEYPGNLVFTGYDSDADVLRFEFRDGDPVPVEDLEIEIADEPYDGDWARGQEEVGEGSVVSIAADAIEPGDNLTVSYDSGEGYSGASTTSVLTHLPVQFSYDPSERRGTIEYVDGPPLPGDRLTLVLGENRTESPWDGQVTAGDSAVIEDVEIGTRATIEYERSDGEQVRVGYGGFRPPGRVEFDYDAPARELRIGYPDHEEEPEGPHRVDPIAREPIPTDEYEIRIDGEPADTQLDEAGETFEPSEAITLTDVPVGVEVEVVWVGEDGRTEQVAGTHTHPEVSFAFERRDDGAVVVRHDGGMQVDAGKLAIQTVGPDERTVQWDGTDTVAEGDQLAIEDVDEAALLLIRYDGEVLAQAHTAEIGNESSDSTDEESDGMEDGSDSTESGSESTEGESGSMGRLFGPVTAR